MIRKISKEKEDGIEQYEIETTLNGHSRDFNVAVDGRLLVVEEATRWMRFPPLRSRGQDPQKMARPGRIELPAPRLGGGCSIP